MADGQTQESREQKLVQTEQKPQTYEVGREVFLAKLTEQDRRNLEAAATIFTDISKEEGLHGGMLIIGGVMEKPFPRKDIDIRVVIETGKTRDDHDTYLDYAKDKFGHLKKISNRINQEIGTQTVEVLDPGLDEEFQSPSILKHEGTIKISRQGTTPIELLNAIDGNMDGIIARERRPFCVLVRT